MEREKTYLCIDLKSFYASVECVERGLDPMTAKLAVADPERTEKTVCLAVTPAMKALGVKNRCRVFEIPPNIDYIMAPPRMALYIDYSARVYAILLKYIAPEDIHVYSIDEAFLDATEYLSYRSQTPGDFARMILGDIRASLGLTATCGVGTNLYLAKIALDILSKHAADNIGFLTEESYRRTLWTHRPLTDFWRIGPGTQARLSRLGLQTMGDVARADQELLYKAFGIDAELLIDHAWGRESATIADIKAYRPESHSLTNGQVLARGYRYDEGRVIVREMAEELALRLFGQGLYARSVTLYLGYAASANRAPVRGSAAMGAPSCSVRALADTAQGIYERIMGREDQIRRVTLSFNDLTERPSGQMDLFSDPSQQERELRLQRAMLDIRGKYGGGSLVKCMDLLEGATRLERNRQIGGHKA